MMLKDKNGAVAKVLKSYTLSSASWCEYFTDTRAFEWKGVYIYLERNILRVDRKKTNEPENLIIGNSGGGGTGKDFNIQC